MAAAMPPSAITVWALPSRDLQTTAVRRPMAWASTAARRPAPPAPMMTTSNSWVSYSVMFSSSLDMEAVVVDGPTGHQSHVQVGEGHEEEAHPCEEHVLPVEGGERLPELVADGRLGELLHPAAAQVPAGVAAEGVEPQQRGVDTQDGRADADPDPEARLAEGLDGVDGQDDVEDEAEVEEVPVDVLEEQREPGLSGVGAVAVGHRAGRRGQPERPVVRLAVVVAGHPEAQREDQDEQGGGDRPPRDHGARVAPRHAALGEAGGVEGRDERAVERGPGEVVLVHEGGPAGVADEGEEDRGRHHGLHPVPCLLYTSPSPRDRTRSRMPS